MKNIFVIDSSVSNNSSNQKLIDIFSDITKCIFSLKLYNDLKTLPHFDPELSIEKTPKAILDFKRD